MDDRKSGRRDDRSDRSVRSRPLASGAGSFRRVWANLEALRRSKLVFDLVLRVHYGFPQEDATRALCRWLNLDLAGDGRFRVVLQRVADLGGRNSGTFKPLPIEEALRRARSYSLLMPNLAVCDVDTAENGICEAAKPNSLLIRTDGRICKCAANLKDPRNEVGRLGEDGRIDFDQRCLQAWFQGYAQLDEDILTCPYKWVRKIPFPCDDDRIPA